MIRVQKENNRVRCESQRLPRDGRWRRGREEVRLFAIAGRKQPQGARRGGFREKVNESRVPGKAHLAF